MTPPSKRKRGSSVSFTTNKGADEIQISLAPYIQTYLAHTGHGLGCCGISLPVPFERAAPRSWWNPRFDSEILEDQYRRSAFPQIRLRFRYALIYILLVSLTWLIYFVANGVENNTDSWPALAAGFSTIGVLVSAVIYLTHTEYYKRCVFPISLGVALMLCLLSLLFVALIPPHADGLTLVGHFAVCSEILLLIYTVLPMPLYACLCICGTYSLLFEFLTAYLYGAYTVDRYTDHLHAATGTTPTNTENQVPSLLSKGNVGEDNFLSNNTATHSRMESLDFTTTLTIRILMQICIHIIGIHILIMTFVRMRGTFMKVGQSLLVRRQLEMEKQLKEKMIHSVMPPKVADWLMEESEREREREDSLKKGSIPSNHTDIRSLFRPFNMHSMEDVSILFADIVGFTKMSSNKTAEELVDILNDLFERFDDLCELNGCEKISTLGDCYYCVSGCPEPRPDHATCCIEMGLAMIEAIKQFDIERREGVNMRVGVHTGTVLCGIVGTKRFKFDVWSNDVTLANKLESTGKPGKVHLSEKTLSFLGDRYLTEEGDIINGVRSYFIRARKSDIMNQFMVKVTSPTSISPLMQTRHRLASCDNQSVKPKNRYFHMLSIANNYRTKANSLPSILDSENDGNNIEVDKETQDDSDSNKSPTSTASYGKKKSRPSKPWRYLQRQHTTEEITGFDDNENKSNGRNTDIVSISQRDESNVIEKDTLGNGVRVDLNPDPTALPSSPLLPSPAVTMRQPISHASSICSRKDSGIRSNSRRSSIQQQLFLMNEMAQSGGGGGNTDLLGHRVSGYYTSSSTLNSTHEPSSAVPPYPFPPIVTDTFGACFHKLRKQSDLQLIRCVQDNVASQRSYFVNPPLSSVTLFFKNKEMEKEYRENAHKASEGFGGNPPTLATSRFNTYFDILVSALVYTGITVSLFLLCQPATHYVVFCAFATGIQAIAVFLCIRQLLDPNRNHGSTITQRIFKFCSRWYPWHVCGALLVGLPIISILLNFSCNETRVEVLERHHYYHYYCSYLVFVGLVHFCNFTQLNCWMKNLLVTIFSGLFVALFQHRHRQATEIYVDVVLLMLLVWFLNREFEISYRLSFHGNAVAARDKARVQSMKNQADWLLHNIIPKYVADQLKTTAKYSQNHKSVGIIFASIVNFNELYDESYLGGKEYLRVLNELIADFDELLEKPEYANVEKIKTIGSTFMAASGLNPSVRQESDHKCTHLFQLMDFALAMQKVIFDFNRDLLGFKLILRVGYNYGDVTAGVIGATKLYYDIWGDAVNIASRMDSTGVPGRIQFASNCVDVLSERYMYEPRGQVYVKGKDNMNVFLITGKNEGTEPLPFRSPSNGESPSTQSPR